MNFMEFSKWVKENGFTFELEALGGCAADTINIYKGGRKVCQADYYADTNYDKIVEELRCC